MKVGFWKRLRIRLTPYERLPLLGLAKRTFERSQFALREKKFSPEAGKRAILKHGKPFIETFPAEKIPGPKGAVFQIAVRATEGSHHPIELRLEHILKHRHGESVGSLMLGFTRDSIIVDGIQGKKGKLEHMHAFNTAVQQTWADALFQRLEAHAKACGFKSIKILRPEYAYYYHFTGEGKPKSPEIQEHMRDLYYTIARHLKYTKEGKYLVKKVN